MSLILETGVGVPNANSYISCADATTYLTSYEPGDVDSWPIDEPSQEAALLVACQALELNYRDKFLSFRRIPVANELAWPRFPFYDRFGILQQDQVIPTSLGKAQATLALYYVLGQDLFPQLSRESKVTSEAIKVGELTSTMTYSQGTEYDPFKKVSLILANIIKSNSNYATSILR